MAPRAKRSRVRKLTPEEINENRSKRRRRQPKKDSDSKSSQPKKIQHHSSPPQMPHPTKGAVIDMLVWCGDHDRVHVRTNGVVLCEAEGHCEKIRTRFAGKLSASSRVGKGDRVE